MELENKEEEAADDDEMVNKDTLIVLSRAQFTCLTYGSVNFHDQLYGRLESYGSVSTYG